MQQKSIPTTIYIDDTVAVRIPAYVLSQLSLKITKRTKATVRVINGSKVELVFSDPW